MDKDRIDYIDICKECAFELVCGKLELNSETAKECKKLKKEYEKMKKK